MDQSALDALKADAKKFLDMPGFLGGLMDHVLKAELQKIVDDTSNPFDNILFAAVYPTLADGVKQAIKTYWDALMAANAEAGKAVSDQEVLGAAV